MVWIAGRLLYPLSDTFRRRNTACRLMGTTPQAVFMKLSVTFIKIICSRNLKLSVTFTKKICFHFMKLRTSKVYFVCLWKHKKTKKHWVSLFLGVRDVITDVLRCRCFRWRSSLFTTWANHPHRNLQNTPHS